MKHTCDKFQTQLCTCKPHSAAPRTWDQRCHNTQDECISKEASSVYRNCKSSPLLGFIYYIKEITNFLFLHLVNYFLEDSVLKRTFEINTVASCLGQKFRLRSAGL